MYRQAKGREIVILHLFIKKSQKIPKKDLDLGRKRMKDVLIWVDQHSRNSREKR